MTIPKLLLPLRNKLDKILENYEDGIFEQLANKNACAVFHDRDACLDEMIQEIKDVIEDGTGYTL